MGIFARKKESTSAADAIRIREEWKRSQIDAQIQATALRALEAEQARQKAEQARLKAEQARQREEQIRQAEEQIRQMEMYTQLSAQVMQNETEIRKLYFRIEQAEDIIAHNTEMLALFTSQRNSILSEIESIDKAIRIEHDLDVYNAMNDPKFTNPHGRTVGDGATAYMDMSAQSDGYKSGTRRPKVDVEKLRKKKTSLEAKLLSLNKSIFSAEQKIKKAEYDKYEAERKMA